MTGEPTAGEVDRALRQFREDIRDDLRDLSAQVRDLGAQLNARLDKMVTLDVYHADKLRADERHIDLRDEVRDLRVKRDGDAKARTTERRWVMGAIILPLGAIVVEVWMKVTGRG